MFFVTHANTYPVLMFFFKCTRSPPIDGENNKTPPSTPRKPNLPSPSKQHRIPPSPHRPSVDAYWNQTAVNDWNDLHSPKKNIQSKRKPKMTSINEANVPHTPSSLHPLPSLTKSRLKQDRTELQRRKRFNQEKYALAASFLEELDQRITKGQIGTLTLSTGGVQIEWSKLLRKTAGRARWWKEWVYSQGIDGTVYKTAHHHAVMDLSEKVIDDERK